MDSWVGKIPWRRDRLPTPVFLGFRCGSTGKESGCDAGDLHSVSGLGRSPGEGKGYPVQRSGLENSTDCIDHGVAKSQTQLSNFHFHFHFQSKGQDTTDTSQQALTTDTFSDDTFRFHSLGSLVLNTVGGNPCSFHLFIF